MRWRRPVLVTRNRGFRLRATNLLVPIATLAVLLPSLGSHPLGEAEAPLALAIRDVTPIGGEPPAGARSDHRASPLGPVAPLAVVLGGMAVRLRGLDELSLRLPGVIAGAATLGALVDVAERLFARRVGLLAVPIVLSLPTGRDLLGRSIGVEPLIALASVGALAAIIRLAEARVAAIVAGMLCGLAVALAGPGGAWIAVLALAWLRHLQGLTARSFRAVVGSAIVALVVVESAALLASNSPLRTDVLVRPRGVSEIDPLRAGGELVALLPLVALGARSFSQGFAGREAMRFGLQWIALAAAGWCLGGGASPFYLGIVLLVTAIATWGIERSRPRHTLAAIAASALLAIALAQIHRSAVDREALDRWALRETGRFVARNISPDNRVAVSPDALGRLSFYAERTLEPFELERMLPDPPRYLIVDREARAALDWNRGARSRLRAEPRSVAEFGRWVVLRIRASSSNQRPA